MTKISDVRRVSMAFVPFVAEKFQKSNPEIFQEPELGSSA